jgi:hypothetical protein
VPDLGTKTLVESLEWQEQQGCLDTSGTVDVSSQSIRVVSGPIEWELPFEIIKTIVVTPRAGDAPVTAITLGDGSVVQGVTVGTFVGRSDLGGFSILGWSVASLSFMHEPETTATFAPRGKHSVVVQKTDGGQIVLTGATFVEPVFSEKGSRCFDHLGPTDTLLFGAGSVTNTVEWSRVSAIAPSGHYRGGDILTLRNGQSLEGSLPSRDAGHAQLIEGASSLGGGYKVRTTVILGGGYAKVELRD